MAKKSKIILCKHCNEEIAKSAKTCPKCGGKNKKPFFKKVWFWLLILLCIVIIGTSGNDDTSNDSIMQNMTEQTIGNTSQTSSSPSSAPIVKNAATEKITIEEQIIFDAENVIITAKKYVDDSIWGEGIQLLIENNSDSDVGIGCDYLIVNDYMITDLFSSIVAAQKKANETLYFSSSQLKAAGITNVGKIEVQFHLFDTDTYMSDYTGDNITIKTSVYETMDTTTDIEGTEIMNLNDIRILAKAVKDDSFWGAAVVLYIENNSNQNVVIQCDDCSINGFMMTPYFSSTVHSSKKAIDSIDFLSSELEQNGIETIEDIELKIKVINADNYSSIYETDPITISCN